MAKRAMDLLLAFMAFVALSPILLATALLVRLKLGSPVFFRQLRPGCGSIPFKIVKFRTMSDDPSLSGALITERTAGRDHSGR